jgi:CspA family cold shock protein
MAQQENGARLPGESPRQDGRRRTRSVPSPAQDHTVRPPDDAPATDSSMRVSASRRATGRTRRPPTNADVVETPAEPRDTVQFADEADTAIPVTMPVEVPPLVDAIRTPLAQEAVLEPAPAINAPPTPATPIASRASEEGEVNRETASRPLRHRNAPAPDASPAVGGSMSTASDGSTGYRRPTGTGNLQDTRAPARYRAAPPNPRERRVIPSGPVARRAGAWEPPESERPRRGPIVDPRRRPGPNDGPRLPTRSSRPTGVLGTISELARDRGFGFLVDGAGRKRFFHRTAVLGSAFETLRPGQKVQFDPRDDVKGLRAVNVRAATTRVATGGPDGRRGPDGRVAERSAQSERGQRRDSALRSTTDSARSSTGGTWRSSLSPFRGEPPPAAPRRRR